jgi:hypothetical protein
MTMRNVLRIVAPYAVVLFFLLLLLAGTIRPAESTALGRGARSTTPVTAA